MVDRMGTQAPTIVFIAPDYSLLTRPSGPAEGSRPSCSERLDDDGGTTECHLLWSREPQDVDRGAPHAQSVSGRL